MNVGEIMTREVLAVAPDTPLLHAVRLMTGHKVSGMPVIGADGRVVGVLTEGDLLRRAEIGTGGARGGWLANLLRHGHEAQDYVLTHGRRTGEVMTDQVITVTEQTPLDEAVRLMMERHVKRLPVVRDGKLVGIVSRADVVRQLASLLPDETAGADDATILRELNAAIDREPWASRMTQITVRNGVVALDGAIFNLREREALGVLAENIPGVKSVENRIVCVDPYMGSVVYDPADDIAV